MATEDIAVHSDILIITYGGPDLEPLRRFLTQAGHRVRLADNVSMALEGVNDQRPDLIITIHHPPHVDGIGTCWQLKQDPGTAEAPVVVCGKDSPELVEQAFQAGAVDYLVDPTSPSLVVRRLELLLENSRMYKIVAGLRQGKEGAGRTLDQLVDERTQTLAKFIEHLKTEINQRREVEQELVRNHQLLLGIIDNSTALITVKDARGRYMMINRQFETLFNQDRNTVVGKTDLDIFPGKYARQFMEHDVQVLELRKVLQVEEEFLQQWEMHTYMTIKFPLLDAGGTPYAVAGIATDITEMKRTRDKLQSEVEGRKRMMLELQQKNQEIQDANTTLKVLLDQHKQTRREIEEQMESNLKNTVLPYIEQLKMTMTQPGEKAYLDIISHNIDRITTSFSKDLNSSLLNLTPREIQVADLIRQGRTNKDISAILQLSASTIESYRNALRKKLGLRNKKVNLRTYLLSSFSS